MFKGRKSKQTLKKLLNQVYATFEPSSDVDLDADEDNDKEKKWNRHQ